MTERAEFLVVAVLAASAVGAALWSSVSRPVVAPPSLPPEETPPAPDLTDKPSLAWVGVSPSYDEPGELGPAVYTANVLRVRPPMPPRPAVARW